jgi:hypothetical protein
MVRLSAELDGAATSDPKGATVSRIAETTVLVFICVIFVMSNVRPSDLYYVVWCSIEIYQCGGSSREVRAVSHRRAPTPRRRGTLLFKFLKNREKSQIPAFWLPFRPDSSRVRASAWIGAGSRRACLNPWCMRLPGPAPQGKVRLLFRRAARRRACLDRRLRKPRAWVPRGGAAKRSRRRRCLNFPFGNNDLVWVYNPFRGGRSIPAHRVGYAIPTPSYLAGMRLSLLPFS